MGVVCNCACSHHHQPDVADHSGKVRIVQTEACFVTTDRTVDKFRLTCVFYDRTINIIVSNTGATDSEYTGAVNKALITKIVV